MRTEARLIEAGSVVTVMQDLGIRAKAAAHAVASASAETKTAALLAAAREIRANAAVILAANAEDVADAGRSGLAGSFIDRLTLTPARLEAMAAAIEDRADAERSSNCNTRQSNVDRSLVPSHR